MLSKTISENLLCIKTNLRRNGFYFVLFFISLSFNHIFFLCVCDDIDVTNTLLHKKWHRIVVIASEMINFIGVTVSFIIFESQSRSSIQKRTISIFKSVAVFVKLSEKLRDDLKENKTNFDISNRCYVLTWNNKANFFNLTLWE